MTAARCSPKTCWKGASANVSFGPVALGNWRLNSAPASRASAFATSSVMPGLRRAAALSEGDLRGTGGIELKRYPHIGRCVENGDIQGRRQDADDDRHGLVERDTSADAPARALRRMDSRPIVCHREHDEYANGCQVSRGSGHAGSPRRGQGA